MSRFVFFFVFVSFFVFVEAGIECKINEKENTLEIEGKLTITEKDSCEGDIVVNESCIIQNVSMIVNDGNHCKIDIISQRKSLKARCDCHSLNGCPVHSIYRYQLSCKKKKIKKSGTSFSIFETIAFILFFEAIFLVLVKTLIFRWMKRTKIPLRQIIISSGSQDYDYDIFLSHKQQTGDKLALLLYNKLEEWELKPFLDSKQPSMSLQNLEQLVQKSRIFLLIITGEVTESNFVRGEIKAALEANKPVILVHDRRSEFPNKDNLPEDIRSILDIKAVPYDTEFEEESLRRLEEAIRKVLENE